MRLYDNGCFWSVAVSADETYEWAHRPNASWPCSIYSGKRVWAQFDKRNGDLVDLKVNGGDPARYDEDANELGAIMADLVNDKAIKRGWSAH